MPRAAKTALERPATRRTSQGEEVGERALSKAETRKALIQAAMLEFAEHGLESPSLDAIAARAGYTRGAFYVHFKDRDDLIAAVMESVVMPFVEAVVASGESAMDLPRTIRAAASSLSAGALPFAHGVPSYQFLQACARSPELRARYVAVLDEVLRRLRQSTERGRVAGKIRCDISAHNLALLLLALVLGLQTLTELGVEVDARDSAEDLLRMLGGS